MSDSDSDRYSSTRHKRSRCEKSRDDDYERTKKRKKSHRRRSRSRSRDRDRDEHFEKKRHKIKTEHDHERVKIKKEPKDRSSEERYRNYPIKEERDRSSVPSGRTKKSRFDNGDDTNDGEQTWGESKSKTKPETKKKEVQKPNFSLSGKLTEDTNTFNGVVIKYSEPPEARMPKKRWRLYPFKGDQGLPTLYIHRQSAYLMGRDRKVADIPIDHPSCSKQHAALQYRLVTYNRPDGSVGKQIRLYIIDLESANGTFINNKRIESKKYVELFEKDVIKFGYSSREYVLLHEHSKGDENSEGE